MSVSVQFSTQRCYCHKLSLSRSSEYQELCPKCVSNALLNLNQLREAALERRNVAREQCLQRLQAYSSSQKVSEFSYESKHLREKLAKLHQRCGSFAVDVAAHVFENDERRAQLEASYLPKEQLKRLQKALYQPDEGSMTREITNATNIVRKLRFQWAIQVIGMFRLDVHREERQSNERRRHARGIGKIGGLPLPNTGPELYGILPLKELQSALRLVAGLTSNLACCLGILLPHPILMQPHDFRGDIINKKVMESKNWKLLQKKKDIPEETSSAATGLLSIMQTAGKSSRTVFKRATGGAFQPKILFDDHLFTPPSMDLSAVSLRLLHAKSAVIAEDNTATNSGRYILAPSRNEDDKFAIGLQLLQNDVVALCIRVGVPVAALWPAEAMLLNLRALFIFCQQKVLQYEEK